MGYHASGAFSLTFANHSDLQAATKALADALGIPTVDGQPASMDHVVEDVWESNPCDDPLEFHGWVRDKWLSSHDTFGRTVALYAATLTGQFRGEDDYGWSWGVEDGALVEEPLVDVPLSEARAMEKSHALLVTLAGLVAHRDTPEGITRVLKIGLLDSNLLTAEMLVTLAHDDDVEVAAAAARHTQNALGGAAR